MEQVIATGVEVVIEGGEVVAIAATEAGFLACLGGAAKAAGGTLKNGAIKAGSVVGQAAANNPVVTIAVIGVAGVATVYGAVKLFRRNK